MDWYLIYPRSSPKVHGVRVELSFGEVVEGAVVQRLEDEVELVVRGHPGLEPELVAYLARGGNELPFDVHTQVVNASGPG